MQYVRDVMSTVIRLVFSFSSLVLSVIIIACVLLATIIGPIVIVIGIVAYIIYLFITEPIE